MSWQQVIADSPFLAFFLIISVGSGLLTCVFRCWNRFLRCMNIRKHGWPPPHCDADGDFKPSPKEEEL